MQQETNRSGPAKWRLIGRLAGMALRAPGRVIKVINGANLRRLVYALKNEDPAYVMRNVFRLIYPEKPSKEAYAGLDFERDKDDQLTLGALRESSGQRVLFIDDRVPHIDDGSGFPRSNLIVNEAAGLGYNVTVYPFNVPSEQGRSTSVYRDLDRNIEIVQGWGRSNFHKFLILRSGVYDIIWVSRPKNMEFIVDHFEQIAPLMSNARLIYDAEAVFSTRAILLAQLKGKPLTKHVAEQLVTNEVELARHASQIVTVNARDAEVFQHGTEMGVDILDIAYLARPSPKAFIDRSGMLFVGNMDQDYSPNVDSIVWFAKKVYPMIAERLGSLQIHLVGGDASARIRGLVKRSPSFHLHGRLENLDQVFNDARIFIAPTRYAAGSPAKVIQAAAYGLPVVATELIADQLGWRQGSDLQVASHEDAASLAQACILTYNHQHTWESTRLAALEQIRSNYSLPNFVAKLNDILAPEPKAG